MKKVYVKEVATGKVVREFDVTGWSESKRDKLVRGLMRQMNLDDFYVAEEGQLDEEQDDA
jgi:hypothetical protein